MADPNPMISYVTPERRRRMGNAMMAEQYAENPPQLPPGYDWNGAPLSPELLAFAAQRGQPGVIQKALGLIPGFDQDGARGRQSWGNAMMSTAQFPVDAVAGMGQALTAPARAYRGEFDPLSEEGVGEALNVTGNAMMGGIASPKPRNSVGSAGGDIGKAGAAVNALEKAKGSRPEPGALNPEAAATGASQVLAETPTTLAPHQWRGNHPYERADEIAEALRSAFPNSPERPAPSYNVVRSGSAGGDSAYIRTPGGEIRISDHFAYPKPGVSWSDMGNNANSMSPQAFVDLQRSSLNRTVQGLIERGGNGRPNWMTGEQWIDFKKNPTLYANGGRPGAALGAIGGVSAQEKAIEDILGQYGIDLPSRPASPQYRPGDA